MNRDYQYPPCAEDKESYTPKEAAEMIVWYHEVMDGEERPISLSTAMMYFEHVPQNVCRLIGQVEKELLKVPEEPRYSPCGGMKR